MTAVPSGAAAGLPALATRVPARRGPAGRGPANVSAGVAAAVVLAAAAGVVLTVLARDDFKGNDLFFTLTTLASAVAYAALGALVIRRAGNRIGWLMLAEGAGLVLMSVASIYSLLGVISFPGTLPVPRHVGTLAESSFAALIFLIVLMLWLFPTGTLPSRRWRPVATLGIMLTALCTAGMVLGPRLVQIPVVAGVSATYPNPFGTARPLPGLIGTLNGLGAAFIPLLAAAFMSLAVRYRTGSWLMRQQVKWLALTAGAFVISMLALELSAGTGQHGLNDIASTVSGIVPLLGIPAAIAVAILKHRLYEIDRIISRSVSYAIVTALLVGVYAGLVLLAVHVLSFSSPVAIACSALAAAAMFSPLRNRVQQAADRRFNRARYDAARTVAAFATRLQGEVDIGAVRADLLGTVSHTLEPVQLSLWLSPVPHDPGRPAAPESDVQAAGDNSLPDV